MTKQITQTVITSERSITDIKKKLAQEFDMKDLGAATKILGIQIIRRRHQKILMLSQEGYFSSILEKHGMHACKPVQVQLPSHIPLSKEDAPSDEDEEDYMKTVPYASIIGSLMYGMLCTRLDDQRRVICEWVQSLKFPYGYASNLSRCVDVHNGRMFGLKSHDCHVFLQCLLPVAFSMLSEQILNPLIEISLFFKELSSTTLTVEGLRQLEANIPVILCKLERIFPPSFFDSMEHLPIHLPYEARVGGPVQYRWMYPFERYAIKFVNLFSIKC